MTKPEVLQLVRFPHWDQQPLEENYTLLWNGRRAGPVGTSPKVRAIVTNAVTGVPASLISACPSLELVAVYGVGCDGIDLNEMRRRGIAVTNTPDVLTDDCADLAMGMALSLVRGIPGGDAWVRSGNWARLGSFPLRHSLRHQKVGIVGLGRIGRAVAERAQAFGMTVGYCGRSPRNDVPACWSHFGGPEELATWCNLMIVCLPGTPENRHVIDRRVLAALGPNGWLINIGRAMTLDEPALIEALESGELAGAALDVFDQEPNIDPRFLTLGNVLLQPHHAAGTIEARRAMGQLLRDNLAAHFAGQPLPTPVL